MSTLPLEGKTAVVFGVASKRSIAWGVAEAWSAAGARLIFNYQGERVKNSVEDLISGLEGETFIHPCDLSNDEEIDAFFDFVKSKTERVDLLLHSVAFAPKEALDGEYAATTREQFGMALDISAYSLVAVTQRAVPLMTEGGSIMTMSYLGAERVVPHYNVMGVAKAALEASVRYLASDLGPKGIRVNAISAGPMNTLAARGISGFTKMLSHHEQRAPMRRNVEMSELGATGTFLAMDGAAAITGQTIYVDTGYSIMAM